MGHLAYFCLIYQHPFLVLWVPCPCFPIINHYFYKKLSLYIHIPNIYLGLGFEFGLQRIRDLTRINIMTLLVKSRDHFTNNESRSRNVYFCSENWTTQKKWLNKSSRVFYYKIFLFLSFFSIINFSDKKDMFFDLELLFVKWTRDFSKGVILFTLVNIRRVKSHWFTSSNAL